MHECPQQSDTTAKFDRLSNSCASFALLVILAVANAVAAQQDEDRTLFRGDPTEQGELGDQSSEIAATQAATTVSENQDSSMQLGLVFQKMSELQSEVSRLLGKIEQLEHQLQVVRQENRERYASIDEQMLQLSGNPTVSSDVVPTGSTDTEEGLYVTAFAQIEDRNFEEAIGLLESLIETYPNGKRLPEAFYWLGETYARLDPPQFEKARQSLVQLVRLYPDHAKAAEGTYKLGTIYEQLGDEPKALEYLDRAANNYPNTTAARLAADYAAAIRNPEE